MNICSILAFKREVVPKIGLGCYYLYWLKRPPPVPLPDFDSPKALQPPFHRPVRPAIHGLNVGWFSRKRPGFKPLMGNQPAGFSCDLSQADSTALPDNHGLLAGMTSPTCHNRVSVLMRGIVQISLYCVWPALGCLSGQ